MNNNRRSFLITALLKAILAILSLCVYQSMRLLILSIIIIWFVIDIIVYRKWVNLFTDLLVICLIIIMIFPCYDYLEKTRFSLFGSMYMSKVEDILKDLSDLPDTDWTEYNKNIIYVKHGNSIIIYFPTSYTEGSGYVYFSDSTARDFWEHPDKYSQYLSEERAYIELQSLKEQWVYVVLFV